MNGRAFWGVAAALVLVATAPAEGAKPKAAKARPTAESVDDRIAKALGQSVRIQFVEATLDDVVAYLREATKVPFVIDQGSLDRREKPKDVLVTINYEGISLSAALDLILHPLDLEWDVWNGTIVLTTSEAAERMKATKIHDVTELVASSDERATTLAIEQLMDVITAIIEPSSWPGVGGKASMTYIQSERINALVVSQSWRAHRQIEELLSGLRALVKTDQPGKSERSKPKLSARPEKAAAIKPAGRTIAGLGLNDQVRIEYTFGGCFHFFAYDFVIAGKAPQKVSVVECVGRGEAMRRRPIGKATLSKLEIERFDNRIAYCRTKPEERCTSGETYVISWLHEGKLVEKEELRDGSCNDSRSLLSLWRLAERTANHSPARPAEAE